MFTSVPRDCARKHTGICCLKLLFQIVDHFSNRQPHVLEVDLMQIDNTRSDVRLIAAALAVWQHSGDQAVVAETLPHVAGQREHEVVAGWLGHLIIPHGATNIAATNCYSCHAAEVVIIKQLHDGNIDHAAIAHACGGLYQSTSAVGHVF